MLLFSHYRLAPVPGWYDIDRNLLKWFRRWKNPDESDWEAFCRHLKYPLSPQRAKGPTFNVEGRRAAGIDPAFIAELNVYSQSKGRTPCVFVFNPFVEGHIAHGRGFTPGQHQTMLASDQPFANPDDIDLPQCLATADDAIAVIREHHARWLQAQTHKE